MGLEEVEMLGVDLDVGSWMRRDGAAILAAAATSSDFISGSAKILPDYSCRQSGSRGGARHQNWLLTILHFLTWNNLSFGVLLLLFAILFNSSDRSSLC